MEIISLHNLTGHFRIYGTFEDRNRIHAFPSGFFLQRIIILPSFHLFADLTDFDGFNLHSSQRQEVILSLQKFIEKNIHPGPTGFDSMCNGCVSMPGVVSSPVKSNSQSL